jgi:hypothetical protein
MSSWDKLKEELTEEAEFQVQELPPLLNKIQKKEVLEAYEAYLGLELKKPVEERKFYRDDYGGTVYIVRFPKKSFVEKRLANNPKMAKNETWQWWGIRLPLLRGINGDDNIPICTVFMPKHWTPNAMWEGEEVKQLVILRGNETKQYAWLNDTKYARFEGTFLKEARAKFENQEIKSIDDILQNPQYKASLDKIKITLNPCESLKVV